MRAAGCVFAEDEARLLLAAATSAAELADLTQRRVDGLPLEQVLGWAEFCGLRIAVDPGVFVPRRRTEFLVAQAVDLMLHPSIVRAGPAFAATPPVVVDLCCGSGAVGAAVLAAVPGIELYCADLEPAAVRCARRNVSGPRIAVLEGDLYEPLPYAVRGRVDVLVANTPYVPTDSLRLMPPEARIYEPRMALDGGEDGLDVQRRIAREARDWLVPGGHLLVETSHEQSTVAAQIFARAGLVPRIARCQELDATVVIGAQALADNR